MEQPMAIAYGAGGLAWAALGISLAQPAPTVA